MARHWRLAPGAEPAVRNWGQECVVHHALANDTFRLAGTAGRVLGELTKARAAGGTGGLAFEEPALDEVLETLVALGLVEAC